MFANAPAFRLERSSNKSKSKDSIFKATSIFHPIAHGIARQESEFEYTSPWNSGKNRGTYRSTSEAEYIESVNGLLTLGSRSSGKTAYPGSNGTKSSTSTSFLAKLDRLGGALFPLTVGNTFAYRTITETSTAGSPPSSYGNLIQNYECRVTEKRAAADFHRELSGDAYVIVCNVHTSWTKNSNTNDSKSAPVFFTELGAFLHMDTIDPKQVNVDPNWHNVLTSVTPAR